MRCISSRATFWNKFGIPGLFLILIALSFLAALAEGIGNSIRAAVPHLLALMFISAAWYLVARKSAELVDEVYDDGDALVVRNDDDKVRIAFSDIKNVEWWRYGSVHIRVTLQKPCILGDRVVFLATGGFRPKPDIEDLIQRVNASHRTQASNSA
jgi:hypothetical protein